MDERGDHDDIQEEKEEVLGALPPPPKKPKLSNTDRDVAEFVTPLTEVEVDVPAPPLPPLPPVLVGVRIASRPQQLLQQQQQQQQQQQAPPLELQEHSQAQPPVASADGLNPQIDLQSPPISGSVDPADKIPTTFPTAFPTTFSTASTTALTATTLSANNPITPLTSSFPFALPFLSGPSSSPSANIGWNNNATFTSMGSLPTTFLTPGRNMKQELAATGSIPLPFQQQSTSSGLSSPSIPLNSASSSMTFHTQFPIQLSSPVSQSSKPSTGTSGGVIVPAVNQSVPQITCISIVKCEFCGEAFPHQQALQKHADERNLSAQYYECNWNRSCPQAFMSFCKLKQHQLTVGHSNIATGSSHPPPPPPPGISPNSASSRKRKLKEKRHLLDCKLCRKRLPNPEELAIHVESHNGLKPFQCRYCDARFARKDKMRIHEIRGTGHSCTCPHCPKRYMFPTQLTMHIRTAHPHLSAAASVLPTPQLNDSPPPPPPPLTSFDPTDLKLPLLSSPSSSPFSLHQTADALAPIGGIPLTVTPDITGPGIPTGISPSIPTTNPICPSIPQFAPPLQTVQPSMTTTTFTPSPSEIALSTSLAPPPMPLISMPPMSAPVYNGIVIGRGPLPSMLTNSIDMNNAQPAAPQRRRRSRDNAPSLRYECVYCPKRFVNESELTRHTRKHTGEKPFSCTHCTKKFAQQGNLLRHLTTHTGERPHKCPECDHAFTDPSSLTRHKRIHSDFKPYTCDKCFAPFRNISNLKAHHVVHHNMPTPHQCKICHVFRVTPSQLKKHMKSHQPKKR